MRKKRELYAAYGSNLNKAQMMHRCPGSTPIGTTMMDGWSLLFRRGVATIVKSNDKCPIALYSVTSEDLSNLDSHEGMRGVGNTGNSYHPYMITVRAPDTNKNEQARIYVINATQRDNMSIPTLKYAETVFQGYVDFNIPLDYLKKAFEELGSDGVRLFNTARGNVNERIRKEEEERKKKEEQAAWSNLGDDPTIQQLEDFLKTFPNGAHAEEAKTKIKQIKDKQEEEAKKNAEAEPATVKEAIRRSFSRLLY